MLTESQKIILENEIYSIVKNYLNEKKTRSWDKGKNLSKNKWSGIKDNSRKSVILNWLKSDTVNKAAIAYELFHAESEADKAAARSLFYKKLYNEKNDNGVPYEFSRAELNTIASIMDKKKF